MYAHRNKQLYSIFVVGSHVCLLSLPIALRTLVCLRIKFALLRALCVRKLCMNNRMKKGFGIPSDLERIMLVGKIGYYICLDLPLKTSIILENRGTGSRHAEAVDVFQAAPHNFVTKRCFSAFNSYEFQGKS